LTFLLAVVVLWCCQNEPESKDPVSRNTFAALTDNAKYVGMQSCRGCHNDIFQTYQHTGMGLSIDSASKSKSAAKLDESSVLYDPSLDLYYHPFWKEGVFMLLEFRLEGEDTTHKRLEEINFIIGSGQHTNSHLISRNGYVHQAPFTYYTQSGILDFPPGFEDGGNTRFSRKIGLECMSCHNGYPKFVEGSENKFESVPIGIDCERCHGPGSIHVNEKSQGIFVDTALAIDYSIVNPSKLEAELQLEVCQRCHLQGNAVLVEGKSFFDFKPGMHLDEVMTVFMPVYEGGENEFIMASHIERFKLSKCYLSESENFNCIDCHNPHKTVRDTRIEKFNSSCAKCHSMEDDCTELLEVRTEENDNCVACHMPSSGSIDIPHVSVHDHRIQIPQENVEESADKIRRFAYLKAINGTPDANTRALGFLQQYEKFNADPQFLDSAAYYISEGGNRADLQIHLWFLQDDFASIIELSAHKNLLGEFGQTSLHNKDAWGCYRVGEAYSSLTRYNEASVYYQQAVDLAPYHLEFRNKLGTNHLNLNNPSKAKEELEFVQSEYPYLPEVNSNLGYIYLTEGRVEEARVLYDAAIALDPNYMLARMNLAGWYFFQGYVDEGLNVLEEALKLDPDNEEIRATIAEVKAYQQEE